MPPPRMTPRLSYGSYLPPASRSPSGDCSTASARLPTEPTGRNVIESHCRWCGMRIVWVAAVAKWRSVADGGFKCGELGLWHAREAAAVDWTVDRILGPPV